MGKYQVLSRQLKCPLGYSWLRPGDKNRRQASDNPDWESPIPQEGINSRALISVYPSPDSH
ncbi:hypothetical protein ACTXT7_016893 [Hymenolepis weldensis]